MILTTQNLLRHLLERGVIEPAAAVDGDVRIAEISRRHRNFKVLRRHGPGLFVKQVKSWDPHTISCLQREGTCSWLAENETAFGALTGRLPTFRDYDPARHALIAELFSAAEGLADYHRRRAEFPPEIGTELGRLLGELHARVSIVADDGRFAAIFPGLVPPMLTLHQAPPAAFQAYGPAAAHVIGLVRQDPTFAQALSDLVGDWRKTALIHGDVKWDNCLLVGAHGHSATSPGEDHRTLKLIDWELADLGDPDWDAGAVFQAYLASWIWSMPATPAPAAVLIAHAGSPLEGMQPAMRAFWTSYCDSRGIDAEDQPRQLRRTLRYGAGRMLQTAFEMAVASHQVSPHVLLLVQLSQNLLTRTDDAVHELVGM